MYLVTHTHMYACMYVYMYVCILMHYLYTVWLVFILCGAVVIMFNSSFNCKFCLLYRI